MTFYFPLLGIDFMYIENIGKKSKKIQGDLVLIHCSEFPKFQRFVSF